MHATDRFSSPTVRCAGVLLGLLLSGVVCLAQPQPPAAGTGARVLVSDVIITGTRQVQAEQVKNMLKTRPGQPYDPQIVQEDVRTLYGTRQFANVSADRQEDGQGGFKVFFFIREYPSKVEKVEYRGGGHLRKDDLETITSIRAGVPLNPMANKSACQAIVRKLNEEGRPFANCTLLKGGDAGDTEVIFNITEGPKVKVRDISFTGHSFVSGAVLRTHINSSRMFLGILGGTYNQAMVEADTDALLKYYRTFGYHDVRVARELQYAPGGVEVTLVFHIQEGVRYRVKDRPTVHGVKCMPHEQLEVLSKIEPGEFFDQRKIDTDIGRIKHWLGNTGRNVKADAFPVYTREAPGIVTVHYQIEETPPARVGEIKIAGNDRTRRNVILRQIPLYPGQILTYPDLRLAENNLKRLGIFDSSPDGAVKPTVTAIDSDRYPNSPVKDILVTVQEANTGSLLFGIGVNSDSGLNGSIVLNERNFDLFRPPTSVEDFINGTAFRGAGQEFRAEAVPGIQFQRYTVSLREPFLFDSPFSLTVSAYYNERLFNEYTEERYGGRVTLGRKIDDKWSASIGARIENVNVNSVPFGAPTDYTSVIGDNFQVGFSGRVVRDTRDSYMRATSGSQVEFSFEEVTGDRTFSLATIDGSKFFTTFQRADGSGKQVLAIHSQVSWASSNTPVFERYFAGGFRSIRGFAFRGVGPDVNGFKVGGDFMVLNSLEYQIPVQANDQVYFVGFLDSGTVTERIDKWDTYRVSAGIGIRFVVPMLGPVPIALDLGFPLAQSSSDQKQMFNFWMGFYR